MTFDGRWRNGESEVIIKLKMYPQSPLLIQAPKDEDGDNKIEALSFTKGDKELFYIPGSSIKGVFRARTEKILYHLLRVDPNSDDKKKVEIAKAKEFYSHLNPVNQLFGHQVFRGRLSIDDAIFEEGTIQKDKRINIAIDRFRGGSKNGALFGTEGLSDGMATTTIRLKNPEAWQVVLLCLLIRDLQEGYITVGAKSGIGFGEMKVDLEDCAIHLYNRQLADITPWKILLEKGKKKGGLYPIYTFDYLDTVATSLEADWVSFLEHANQKEEVKA